MLRFRASAAIAMVLIFLTSYFGPELAFADEQQQAPPPAEHKGVIPPPPVGDEGIYTDVPNPEAGHEKEVIPPPGAPGGDPNVEPR